ncbi:MAG: hypothetical protein FWG68_01630 [Defluviitaleaceae bacterium]|nr:hypothetical protein [Defluviitaleaceae bacterium]
MNVHTKQKSNKYEDIINLLHGNLENLIDVNNVTISVFDIAYIYEGVKMGDTVIKKIISAHDKVLTYGLQQGNEMLVAIDLLTGETVEESYGTAHAVNWQLDKDYRGKVITIHNHPSNANFSPTDLFTFSVEKRVYMSVIQCHDGRIFSLRKRAKQCKPLSKEMLEIKLLEDFKNSGIKSADDIKINSILDKYVFEIQQENNWIYKRR